MPSFILYILLTHTSCTILFYGVGGYRLKINLSNYLPKIKDTCINYF